jgi:hypothetical protein
MTNGRQLGDIQWKDRDPLETYFDILRMGARLPRRAWIVKPEWRPCNVAVPPGSGADIAQKMVVALQEMLECHVLPRQWQMLMDLWIKLQCGTYFVKRPNWIEPPITARGIDARTEAAVALGLADTTILTFTVPDRFVGTLLGFGHDLTDAALWGTPFWNIRINNEPAINYQNFQQQIGTFVNPTLFPNPIRLKHQDVVTVTGRSAVAASAFARLIGFMFPVRTITQDGSFGEYHTI